MLPDVKERRPIATRDTRWAQSSARWLRKKGVRPDHISFASMVCALVSGAGFLVAFEVPTAWLRGSILLLAALMIQGRLICNLLDGMVAVEGGMGSPAGAVWNELPDRISDSLILLGAGYGLSLLSWGATLGWSAALLALMTAYLRLLGGVCGLKQQFLGPMAKQQRMAVLCLGAILAMWVPVLWGQWVLLTSLFAISVGTLYTCWRRGRSIVLALNARGESNES